MSIARLHRQKEATRARGRQRSVFHDGTLEGVLKEAPETQRRSRNSVPPVAAPTPVAEGVREDLPATSVGAGTDESPERDVQQPVSRRRGTLLPAPSAMPAPATITTPAGPSHRRTAIRDNQLQPDSLSVLREQEDSKLCAAAFPSQACGDPCLSDLERRTVCTGKRKRGVVTRRS